MLSYSAYSIFQHYFRYTHRMAFVSGSGFGHAGFTLLMVFLMVTLGRRLSLNSLVGAQVASCLLVVLLLGMKVNSEVGLKLAFNAFAGDEQRAAEGQHGLFHMPGLARLQGLGAVNADLEVTLYNQAFNFWKLALRAMAGLGHLEPPSDVDCASV